MVKSEKDNTMDMEVEHKVFTVALEAGVKASARVLRYWPSPKNPHLDQTLTMELFHKEGSGNFATTADHASKNVILAVLKRHGILDTHGVNSEESERKRNIDAKWQWLIDEIDGTQNFNSGSYQFGVNISAFYDGEPVVGVLAMPAIGRIITAQRNTVTLYTLDGTVIEQIESLSKQVTPFNLARIGFDMPYTGRKEQFTNLVAKFADHVGGTLQYGSCAASNYEVVLGSLDGYITPIPSWYDIGAPLAILSAIGVVTDISGNKIRYSPGKQAPSYVATRTLKLHEELLKVINS